MSQERFDALLARMVEALGRTQVPHLQQDGLLEVAGSDVLILHVPEHQCRVLVDLGPLVPGADAVYLRRMLELNLARDPAGWPVLSLHPGNGHVIAILDLALEDLEADSDGWALLTSRVPAWIEAWRDERHGPMTCGSGADGHVAVTTRLA